MPGAPRCLRTRPRQDHQHPQTEEIRLNIRHAMTSLIRPQTVAHAHCDIPCGIYDPKAAQTGAETVEKMMTLIADLGQPDSTAKANSFARYVAVKEQHAELVKHEVRVIWGDYIKPPMVERYPDIHEKVWRIMQLGSACRQGTDLADAQALRAAVDEFAEIFWATKQG